MKKNLLIIVLIIQFAFGIHTLLGQDIQYHNDLEAKIDNYLNASSDNGYAASVLVAKQGDIILSKGYGWSDRNNKILNTSSSVFNIAPERASFEMARMALLGRTSR